MNRRDFISGSTGAMVAGALLTSDSVAAGKPGCLLYTSDAADE